MSNTQTRVLKFDNGVEMTQKTWTSEYGLTFWCLEKSCVFCENCSDIWYDGTGPYMFACEKNDEKKNLTVLGYVGKCPEFKEATEEKE